MTSPNPMYRQIAEDLRAQIESGDLQAGQQLRTETELKEHYRASRNTVRDATKWLTSLGLVETRPGQGTFVVKKIDPLITTLSADPASGLGGGEGANYLSEVAKRSPGALLPRASGRNPEGVRRGRQPTAGPWREPR